MNCTKQSYCARRGEYFIAAQGEEEHSIQRGSQPEMNSMNTEATRLVLRRPRLADAPTLFEFLGDAGGKPSILEAVFSYWRAAQPALRRADSPPNAALCARSSPTSKLTE